MSEKGEEYHDILKMHIKILKLLVLWPFEALSEKQNLYILRGHFVVGMILWIPPVLAATVYQIYVGIDDRNTLVESLIGLCDICGWLIAYVCVLRNQKIIQALRNDINGFLKYSGHEVIREADAKCTRYTKYLTYYVVIGIIFNILWPLMAKQSCIRGRVSEFYIKHDPCGLTTHNLFPFDATKPLYFWAAYISESLFLYHICLLFSTATATVIGFLIHITEQLKACGYKFEHVFDNDDLEAAIQKKFVDLIKYHQQILKYAERVCVTFSIIIVIYISITSFSLAIIGYQIANPKTTIQDRIRYAFLLIGWTLLFFLISFYAQELREESVKVGNSMYKSKWYKNGICVKLHKDLTTVLLRTQRPLAFKVELLGVISLERFLSVMKTAYSVFTLLLTVTDDE